MYTEINTPHCNTEKECKHKALKTMARIAAEPDNTTSFLLFTAQISNISSEKTLANCGIHGSLNAPAMAALLTELINSAGPEVIQLVDTFMRLKKEQKDKEPEATKPIVLSGNGVVH